MATNVGVGYTPGSSVGSGNSKVSGAVSTTPSTGKSSQTSNGSNQINAETKYNVDTSGININSGSPFVQQLLSASNYINGNINNSAGLQSALKTLAAQTYANKTGATTSNNTSLGNNYLEVDAKTGKGSGPLQSSNTALYDALAKQDGLTGIVGNLYANKLNPVTKSSQTQALSDSAATTKDKVTQWSQDAKNAAQVLAAAGITDNASLNAALAQMGLGPVNAHIDYTPLDRSQYNFDNVSPSVKAGLQELATALQNGASTENLWTWDREGVAPDNGKQVKSPTSVVDNGNGGGNNGQNGGGSGGGGGYSSYSSLLSQLAGGTGLGGLGGGTATPYSYISQSAGANPEAAAAYAQLLKNAGYDLNQPLSDIALPNRIALPEEVALPENFNFAEAYNNIPEVQIGRVDRVDTHPEEEMLGQIADLQSQQAILSADNTVNNGITELQRVMQNAQDQYQAQQNQIAMDEARAKDNQVLYNEARGDRGGIGQAQYDTIQNTAATNRLTVQKEQTQLATDTARQIADLRSQGEFEKANQLLSISQKYLSELMDLYQWAKETNVSIDEFNLQVAQWEENFKLSLVGAELDAEAFNLNVANARIDQENNRFNAAFNQENALFDARLNAAKLQNDEALARLNAQLNAANATGTFANGTPTYAATQDAIANQLKERSMLADIGTALIKAGIQPSNAILEAMGMGGTATGAEGGALAGTALSGMDATSVLRAMGIGNAGLAGISALGYTPESFLAEALGEGTGTGTVAGLPALGSTTTQTTQATPSYTDSDIAAILDQLINSTPNTQSNVAAYTQPTQTTQTQMAASTVTPTLMDYYNAGQILKGNGSSPVATTAALASGFDATGESLLRAAGIGNDGLAGLAYLGVSPASVVSSIYGL